ncbi:acyl-CoA thioesterase [Nocardia nova]|uniref:acyl-CoA thioesterase n=1 Tax=Nocardia nova TaxID=37330 RepID=UPI003794CD90
MVTTVRQILDLLELEQCGAGHYRGPRPSEERERLFGGHIAAQALMAASKSVPDDGRVPLGFHCYFLRQGLPDVVVDYTVEQLRHDESSSTCRITAAQGDRIIFEAIMGFGAFDPGVDDLQPIPEAPDPDTLERLEVRLAPFADEHDGWWIRPRPFDIRYVNAPPRIAVDQPVPSPPQSKLWLRAEEPVPDDPIANRCMLTYLSDMTLLDPVMLATRRTTRGPGFIASLDHTIWFHHYADFSDWLLYDKHAPSIQRGRGLARGRIFNRSGGLTATVVQEGVLGR